MRNGADVAKRCVCVEITRQRAAIEGIDPEQAEVLRAHYPRLVEVLDLEAALLPIEAKTLEAELGDVPRWDSLVGSTSLQCAVLLWALGRVDRLPTVASVDDGSFLDDLGRWSFLGIADIDVLKASIETAELRDGREMRKAFEAAERSLSDASRLMHKGIAKVEKLTAGGEAERSDLIAFSVIAGLAWVLDRERSDY
ncbi:MAG: hypothetical protein KF819_19320 [Labilithrix sp.]|nr:hypothetical protein [Labilithrix sp.]